MLILHLVCFQRTRISTKTLMKTQVILKKEKGMHRSYLTVGIFTLYDRKSNLYQITLC